MEHKIKLLVIACNTASAYAMNKLKAILNIPIIDVIQPGADCANMTTKTNALEFWARVQPSLQMLIKMK